MTRPRFIGGALLATFLAGPIAVLLMAMTFVVTQPSELDEGLVAFVFMLVFSLPIGIVISLLPNVFGAMAMAHWGQRDRRVRHPLVWMTVGAMAGALVGLAVFSGPDGQGGAEWWFATVGALCALICRWGTSWAE